MRSHLLELATIDELVDALTKKVDVAIIGVVRQKDGKLEHSFSSKGNILMLAKIAEVYYYSLDKQVHEAFGLGEEEDEDEE